MTPSYDAGDTRVPIAGRWTARDRREACPCPAHRRIAAIEEANRAAEVCESRARSLAANGQILAANEALKCAEAIRRAA